MNGGPVEQNLTDMDAKLTAMRIRQHPELIVGVKVAHYGGPEWDPVTRAVEAGRETMLLNLLTRHNLPFVLIPPGRLNTAALASMDLLIALDEASGAQVDVLSGFVRKGGAVVLTSPHVTCHGT